MRIATWNINSVRLRINRVADLAKANNPDVICLQETKVVDDLFPLEAVQEMGYPHVAISGMKGYNGVAILSKLPLKDIQRQEWCGKTDCRHIAATLPGGIELHNFYIPAGGDEPDREKNDKFGHKLDFLDEMTEWFPANRTTRKKMVLVGDLNIAPLETDVWSHKQLLKIVSHTPLEVEKLDAVQRTVGWIDAVRHFIPPEEKLYSWWSYRARDWNTSDKGRRLDHIWVTPPLASRLQAASVLRTARGWEKASDHAPVLMDMKAA